MITPLRKVEAGGDQENVMVLALRRVTVKVSGGPVGAGNAGNNVYLTAIIHN